MKHVLVQPIPEVTTRVARKAFHKCNVVLQMRNLLGNPFSDDHFIDLYPIDSQPTYSLQHWALVDGLGSVRGMMDEAFTVEGSRGFAFTVDGCRPQSSADAPAPAEGGSS